MRLIDADALIDKALQEAKDCFGILDFGICDIKINGYDIEHAPTVEAEPITHTHWEIGINEDKFCSNCGTYAGFAYRGSRKYQELSNYCRYCGAIMDEET